MIYVFVISQGLTILSPLNTILSPYFVAEVHFGQSTLFRVVTLVKLECLTRSTHTYFM